MWVWTHVSAIFSNTNTIRWVGFKWSPGQCVPDRADVWSEMYCQPGHSSSSQPHSWPQATTVLLTDTTARPLTQQNPTANILIGYRLNQTQLCCTMLSLASQEETLLGEWTIRYVTNRLEKWLDETSCLESTWTGVKKSEEQNIATPSSSEKAVDLVMRFLY